MRYFLLAIASALLFSGNADAARKRNTQSVFSTKSFLVASRDGHILKEQASDTVVPIASISKLMVGILAIEQDLNESLPIPPVRQVQSSIPRKLPSLTRKELLILSLVKSDNFAAQILCNNIPSCVEKMNSRAVALGMHDTQFMEPTGLSKGNVSTAHDLLKLVIAAGSNAMISQISSMPMAEVGKIKINNTNPLTKTLDVSLSKTGFTNPAGGCLVMIAGQHIFILLGSKNAHTRIPDTVKLVKEL